MNVAQHSDIGRPLVRHSVVKRNSYFCVLGAEDAACFLASIVLELRAAWHVPRPGNLRGPYSLLLGARLEVQWSTRCQVPLVRMHQRNFSACEESVKYRLHFVPT